MDSTINLTPDCVKKKLVENVYTIKNVQSKSAAWNIFGIVCDNGVELEFAACKSCKHVYKYNSKTGTSTMARHRCNISKNQTFLFTAPSRTVPLHGTPSLTEMKDKITSSASERVFSHAGYVVSARRSSLSSNSVDSVLFINSLLRAKKTRKLVK